MRLSKEVWIGWIASCVEAYNMAIYSFVAPLLAKQIFQQETDWKALLFFYLPIFLGSCLLYPIGAIYYGFIGDRLGRQKICIYATLGLAAATGLMGCIPVAAHYAWIGFLILVCAQYFFSGGEYHGSVIFSLEHYEQKQSGLMSSLSCLFAVFGLVAANCLATLALIEQNLFGMRFCFFVGAIGGLISYLLKNHCRETPAFIAFAKQALKPPELPKWSKIAPVVAVLAFFMTSYAFIFLFLPLVHPDQSFDTMKTLVVYGLLLVLAGWAADRIGIKRLMAVGICLFSAVILPLCYLCGDLFIVQLILTACACCVIGPIHSWILLQFNVGERCRGIFISSAIATALFGGSTVPVCLMILEKFNSVAVCCLYPLAVSLGSLICVVTRKRVEVLA